MLLGPKLLRMLLFSCLQVHSLCSQGVPHPLVAFPISMLSFGHFVGLPIVSPIIGHLGHQTCHPYVCSHPRCRSNLFLAFWSPHRFWCGIGVHYPRPLPIVISGIYTLCTKPTHINNQQTNRRDPLDCDGQIHMLLVLLRGMESYIFRLTNYGWHTCKNQILNQPLYI